jgi:ribosomal protein S27AE
MEYQTRSAGLFAAMSRYPVICPRCNRGCKLVTAKDGTKRWECPYCGVIKDEKFEIEESEHVSATN